MSGKLFLYILMFVLSTSTYAKPIDAKHPIVGNWQTFDDKTNAKRTIVHIAYSEKKKSYYARIIKRFKNIAGMTQSDTCVDCPAPFTNVPILNMVAFWNLKEHKKLSSGAITYNDGYGIDPETGKRYSIKVKLSASGDTLMGVAYIKGLPLLSRKQYWIRDKSDQQ